MKWVPRTQEPVPKLKNHTATHCNNKLYIYGGFDGTRHLSSLHVLDTKKWTWNTSSSGAPSARNGHTATLYKNFIYVIGGWNGQVPSTTREIHLLNTETLEWSQVTPEGSMVPCNMHTADLYQDKIYIFRGGDGSNYLSDLHCLDILKNSLQKIQATGFLPTCRANHSSCVWKSKLFLFGGWNGIERLNDLYFLDLETYVWEKPQVHGNLPCPRAGTTLSSVGKNIVLFGGSGKYSACYNDLYVLEPETHQWAQIELQDTPCPRSGHTCTLISERSLLVFGGSNGVQYNSSFFELDTDPPPALPKTPEPLDLRFNLGKLVNNPEFSDIKFIVEGRTIYAHKVIISQFSEKFKVMFESGMRECRESQIELKDIKYRSFMILLKFLYTGSVEIDAGTEGQNLETEFLLELLKDADRFLLEPVLTECERMLYKRIDQSNALEVFSVIENLRADYLKEYCQWVVKHI